MQNNGIENGYEKVCVCHKNPKVLGKVSPLPAYLLVPASWVEKRENGKPCVPRERLEKAELKWQPTDKERGVWLTPRGFQIANGSCYRVEDKEEIR